MQYNEMQLALNKINKYSFINERKKDLNDGKHFLIYRYYKKEKLHTPFNKMRSTFVKSGIKAAELICVLRTGS